MLHKLSKQATFGIISPAYFPKEERIRQGIDYLQQRGFKIKMGTHISQQHGYFAGRDEDRLADLHAMYGDQDVKVILCTRGGWGSLRLVDKLDYQLIQENPKPLIGYSDITTLQLAIWNRTGLPALSGPMLAVEMGKGITSFTEHHFWNQLFNASSSYTFNFSSTEIRILRPGLAKGILLGGCLSMVVSLLGTPYSPNYDGAILFLEDTGEKPYRIDRYLAQLQQAGVFRQINGLIMGQFLDCNAEEGEISFTLPEIFEHYFGEAEYPVLLDFPYGHGDDKFTMPVGVNAILDTPEKSLRADNPFMIGDFHT